MTTDFDGVPQPTIFVRIINAIGGILRPAGAGSQIPPVEKLLASATRKTGLSDFGDDYFLEYLGGLLRCFENAPNISPFGRMSLLDTCHKALCQRLFIERDIGLHPEILDIAIKKPIIITGFPRSGTSFLQNLLLQHPGCRWPRIWELGTPFPSPEVCGSDQDPRKARFERWLPILRKMDPYSEDAHAMDSPAECWMLMLPAFAGVQMIPYLEIEAYREWSDSTVERSQPHALAYYEKHLQLLTWYQAGCHWVLKSPDHVTRLPELVTRFPDARIIHIHRDPKKVVPSACTMTYLGAASYLKCADPARIGRMMLSIYEAWGHRCLDFRTRHESHNVHDLFYTDLVEDPMAAIRGIYDHFHMEWPPEMERNLKGFIKRKHGANRPPKRDYALEQYGLSARDVNRAFEDYCNYFNLNSDENLQRG